ncbi:MAG: hypothetical protein E7238_05255 [Sarcina sp.]|nr:hypothetical protein [Sarcina sp.]
MKTSFKKRTLSAALILAMLVMLLVPMSVSAASKNYRVKALGAGKWAAKSYKYNYDTGIHYTYYKITVSRPGRLNFTFSSDGFMTLNTSLGDIVNSKRNGSYISKSYRSDCKMVAVEKGTYYMNVSSGKVRYSFAASGAPTNYCVARAKALKANTAAYNVFTPRTNYCRWYRISTPKKKKIVYWANTASYAYDIQVFDSRMRRLETVKNGSDVKYCTKAAQPKGTYYILVRNQLRYANDYNYAFGDVKTFKWN